MRLAVSGTAFLIIEITSALERDDLVQRLWVAHANIDVTAVDNRNTSGAPILGEVMVIPPVLHREIVSVRPDEAPLMRISVAARSLLSAIPTVISKCCSGRLWLVAVGLG
jgi:hypothetical protein